jgi:hypothetical protein
MRTFLVKEREANTMIGRERGPSLLLSLRRAVGSDCGHGEIAAHSIRWRYHVLSRGDRREPIFHDDTDRVEFLRSPSPNRQRGLGIRRGLYPAGVNE